MGQLAPVIGELGSITTLKRMQARIEDTQDAAGVAAAVTAMVSEAVERLGQGPIRLACERLLGVGTTRGLPRRNRRRAAREVLDVGEEHFRKHREYALLRELAAEIVLANAACTPTPAVPTAAPEDAAGTVALGTAEHVVPGDRRKANDEGSARRRGQNAVHPMQLPPTVKVFVGRQRQTNELKALAELAADPRPTIVVVDGAAGVGKTTFVVRWAHQAMGIFTDGVLMANLRGFDPTGCPADPEEVLDGFLIAMGETPSQIPVGVGAKTARYRTLLTDRRMLVVLDNAADSTQVRPLIPATSGSMVVINSRNRLPGLVARDDAVRITLGPLSTDEAIAMLRILIGSARVEGEPRAATAVACYCGHLPLFMRVAAERIASQPEVLLSHLARELAPESRRLDSLATSEDETAAARPVLSWSYAALSVPQARFFRLVGLHPGMDITVPAAAALAGLPQAETTALLRSLAGIHLLEEIGLSRYQFHDLLRVYAAEQGSAEEPAFERKAAVDRLLEWYLHTTYAANRALAPHRNDPPLPAPAFDLDIPRFSYDDGLSWCEAELPNLVAMTRLAWETGNLAVAWKLPLGLWNFFHLRKQWTSWVAIHQIGLQAAEASGDEFAQAWIANNLANAYREQHRHDEAEAHLARALRLRQKIGDQVGQGWTLYAIAFVDCDRNHLEDAAEHLRQATGLFQASGTRDGEGAALASLGDILRRRHLLADATHVLRRALAIFTSLGDRDGQGLTHFALGEAHRDAGDRASAVRCFREALVTYRAIGDRSGEAQTLHAYGGLLAEQGEKTLALDAWREALAIFNELGDPRAQVIHPLVAGAQD
ncbi:MAG: ATP-binding protein [Pseudonocardiaceae bacterium]